MDERVETGANGAPLRLKNDTVVNVAQLLQEHVGAARKIALALDWFALDADLMAKDVRAEARLTRIGNGILGTGRQSGIAMVECVRCLELFEQPFEAEFDQEYQPTVDVRSGQPLEQAAPEAEIAPIDERHELDLAEPLRQTAILALPMMPICREDCPGIVGALADDDEPGDRRLGVLEQLLHDSRSSRE
jgi:uncharacterized protein